MISKRLKKTPFNYEFISALLLIIVAILGFISLFLVPYSYDDTGYYFKYAQEISNGLNGILYRDIEINYSPLPIYLYSFVFKLSDGLPLNGFLLCINYIFILGTCFFIFKIGKNLQINKSYLLFGITLYLISIVGIGIWSTEHFVVFFEVLMVYLLFSKKHIFYVLAGLSAFLAFYSKQYGLVAIALGGFYFITSRSRIKDLPFYIIGLLIPNIVLFLIYNNVNNFSLFDLYEKLLFPQTNEALLTGEGYNFIKFIKGFIQFSLIVPYVSIAFYFFFSKKLYLNFPIFYILIFGLANLTPLFIATFLRYYLLPLPFVIIFSLSTIENPNTKGRLKKLIGILVALSITSSVGAFVRMKKINGKYIATKTISIHPNLLLHNECKKLNAIIPRGSKVFIVSSVYYFYPADFYSIDIKNLGYTWGQQYNEIDDILKYLDKGEFILTRINDRFPSYSNFIEKTAKFDPGFEVYEWVSNYPKESRAPFYILKKK